MAMVPQAGQTERYAQDYLTVPVQVDGVGGCAKTALDDPWKAKMNDVLWGQVKKKHVLDFSERKTGDEFGPEKDKDEG